MIFSFSLTIFSVSSWEQNEKNSSLLSVFIFWENNSRPNTRPKKKIIIKNDLYDLDQYNESISYHNEWILLIFGIVPWILLVFLERRRLKPIKVRPKKTNSRLFFKLRAKLNGEKLLINPKSKSIFSTVTEIENDLYDLDQYLWNSRV